MCILNYATHEDSLGFLYTGQCTRVCIQAIAYVCLYNFGYIIYCLQTNRYTADQQYSGCVQQFYSLGV